MFTVRREREQRSSRTSVKAAILTESSLKMTVYKIAARDCKRILSTILRNNRAQWTTKVYTERLRPLSPLYTIFEKKDTVIASYTPFRIPRLELCIPFNCCKCTVFQIWIDHKTRAFSRLFHHHKMHLLALMASHFTDRNDYPPYPFIYFNKRNPYPFMVFHTPEAWNKYPFRAEPPRIGHYREYPPGCEQSPRLLPPFSFT